MSFKSLLQTLFGIPAREVPRDLAEAIKPGSITPQGNPFIDRLKGRSDWPDDLSQGPLVAPWDRPAGFMDAAHKRAYDEMCHMDKWPATDDPYAAPEPCPIVPDPALKALTDLKFQALTRPLDSVKSVTDLLHLIERQEAAELHLTKLGMVWTRERGWHLPDPYLA